MAESANMFSFSCALDFYRMDGQQKGFNKYFGGAQGKKENKCAGKRGKDRQREVKIEKDRSQWILSETESTSVDEAEW